MSNSCMVMVLDPIQRSWLGLIVSSLLLLIAQIGLQWIQVRLEVQSQESPSHPTSPSASQPDPESETPSTDLSYRYQFQHR